MSGIPDVSELTDAVMQENFDIKMILRGHAYALSGKANVRSVTPGGISGEVAGSGHNLYQTSVEWSTDALGTIVWSECSCPVGDGCKHAVALIITQRDSTHGALAPAQPGSSRGLGVSWRAKLSGLGLHDEEPAQLAPLALEVAVVKPNTSTRFDSSSPVVTLRPMRMGTRGKWIKTGVSWREITSGYSYNLRDFDQAHVSALSAFLAACDYPSYSVPTAVSLARCGPSVWTQLRRLVSDGVALVPDGRTVHGVVLADEAAHISIDLTSGDGEGAMTMTTSLVHGDQRFHPSSADVGLLGPPYHGMFIFDGADLRLIPFDREFSHGVARLLTEGPVVVPPEDVEEFLDLYPPKLRRIAKVGSSDDSVTIAETQFEGLVLIIDRPTIDKAMLSWAARYRRGNRVSTFRLTDPSSRGRDFESERQAVTDLELPVHILPTLISVTGRPANLSLAGSDVITLLNQVVPWLEQKGQVTVEIHGDMTELRAESADPTISLSVSDQASTKSENLDLSHNDWFDLEVEVRIDGQVIEFVDLFMALSRGDTALILDSGTWLYLDRPEFDKLRELIEEGRGLADFDRGDGSLRINRFQTSFWEELSSLGVVANQSKRWADNVTRLSAATEPKHVDQSPGLKATLRPYQQQGLDWLAFLHEHELGGILADDMGLGKTIQTLALFLHVLDKDPQARFLVVAPTSVVENWRREADRFAPGVPVATISETAKRRGTDLSEAVGDARIVVTSYALFRIDFADYQSLKWDTLVLDEAQFVKNHTGKTYQCARRLGARTKIAITGTPLENSLMDLWSLLSIVAPGLYPDPKRFSEVYRKPIEAGKSPQLLSTLRRRVSPLMRRRTKGEVLDDLPPKVEQIIDVEMSPKHARIYHAQLQRQRQKVLGLVDDVNKNRFEILKSLTLLRQLSLDPGLVDPDDDDVGSAKLDRLVEDLTQVIAEGHRALVFSQFTRYLLRVRDRLDDQSIEYAYLDGKTRNRDREISRFKDGDVPVFVISLKAGGFGLNLTEADYCFVLDPWWNPAVETQAVDRTHRIGQRNQVMVYRYVSTGTIEDKVIELKERKAALFASVMDADGSMSGALSADDIKGLFA